MRSRITVLSALMGIALISSLVAVPAQAEPHKKFEATLTAPGLAVAEQSPDLACPEAGDLDGTFYKFFDLEGEYKNFKVYGPAHLFDEPEPVGIHNINDYDIDMYIFDKKCNDITPDMPAPWAGTHIAQTKKPGRYVIVTYWSGIHPQLPITLEVSHNKLK